MESLWVEELVDYFPWQFCCHTPFFNTTSTHKLVSDHNPGESLVLLAVLVALVVVAVVYLGFVAPCVRPLPWISGDDHVIAQEENVSQVHRSTSHSEEEVFAGVSAEKGNLESHNLGSFLLYIAQLQFGLSYNLESHNLGSFLLYSGCST